MLRPSWHGIPYRFAALLKVDAKPKAIDNTRRLIVSLAINLTAASIPFRSIHLNVLPFLTILPLRNASRVVLSGSVCEVVGVGILLVVIQMPDYHS